MCIRPAKLTFSIKNLIICILKDRIISKILNKYFGFGGISMRTVCLTAVHLVNMVCVGNQL